MSPQLLALLKLYGPQLDAIPVELRGPIADQLLDLLTRWKAGGSLA